MQETKLVLKLPAARRRRAETSKKIARAGREEKGVWGK